jgi:CRISPR system Cascade subunit CasA
MLNVLEEQLISTVSPAGRKTRRSLPGAFAALVRSEIASFSSLRPHQHLVWHAFLVQIATLALENADEKTLPDCELEWRDLLAHLTSNWPGGEPWHLLAQSATKPALMQAPIPGGSISSFRRIETPDSLDMLITSKNHDLKRERMWNVEPEDWLYALISLQTQEGIMGGGKYGISRMNGGFGSRSMMSIDSPGDHGFRFRRDVTLLRSPSNLIDGRKISRRKGISLVWVEPWDGSAQIPFHELHPLYVEICRRVRLRSEDGRVYAMESVTSKPRIACPSDMKGNTGDPWMAVSNEGKAFSVGNGGFSYRKVSELLNPEKFRLPELVRISDNQSAQNAALVFQAVCRGQGKTEGYHERRLPFGLLLHKDLATAAERRVEAMGELRSAFRLALFVIAQGGPEKVAADKEETRGFVEPYLECLEREIDRTFFQDLEDELSSPESDRESVYQEWLEKRVAFAETQLLQSCQSLPHPFSRRYQARARAGIAFRGRLSKSTIFKFAFSRTEIKEKLNELNKDCWSRTQIVQSVCEYN